MTEYIYCEDHTKFCHGYLLFCNRKVGIEILYII